MKKVISYNVSCNIENTKKNPLLFQKNVELKFIEIIRKRKEQDIYEKSRNFKKNITSCK